MLHLDCMTQRRKQSKHGTGELMMREILFRGKRVDNGEWAQGYYIRADYHWHKYGIHKDWIALGASANGGWFALHSKYAVKSETVGQYIGLKDKDGKKIFEGDVVIYRDRIFDEVVGVIEYDDGCFCVHTLRSPNSPAIDIVMNESEVEVIGNIHDDKEILNDSTV